MERFSRSASAFNEVKSHSLRVRREHDSLLFAQRSPDQHAQDLELDGLSSVTIKVLDALAQLEASPEGHIQFSEIVEATDKAFEEATQVLEHIWQLQREEKPRTGGALASSGYYVEPLRNVHSYVLRLQMALQQVADACNRANALANSQLLLLKGDSGTGKTHLLCDFAKRRIRAQLPTLLLMGQRFLSDIDPWAQSLQQLDLSQSSAEEFVGALEAAAQASGCRAMVMIDALNEGNGRRIWPAHLPSFLARLEKSPWIGVILSIRSSYEEIVIPKSVRDSAVVVTHHGFEGHEFDATRTFFALLRPRIPVDSNLAA